MQTLLDYAATHFPGHTAEVWTAWGWTVHTVGEDEADADGGAPPGELELTAHTTLAHVAGPEEGRDLIRLVAAAGWSRLSAVLVCPAAAAPMHDPSTARRRWWSWPAVSIAALVAAAAAAATVVVVSGAVVVGASIGAADLVVALLGCAFAVVDRRRRRRSFRRPTGVPRPGVALVAVLTDSDDDAREAARLMTACGAPEVRLLDGRGGWRLSSR